MPPTLVNHDAFAVIGIARRASNDKAAEEIGPFWGRFFAENIMQSIPNKIGDDVIAL